MNDMTIKDNTIIFKSKPDHWEKEHSGVKPNTVRYLNADEWEEFCFNYVEYISIVNTDNGHTFHRKIVDVTCAIIMELPVFIFSWDHCKFVEKDSMTCIKKNTTVPREVNDGMMKGI